MPRKRKLSPKKLDDIQFVKFKRVDDKIVKGEKRNSLSNEGLGRKIEPVDQDSFAEKLKQCAPQAAWLLTREDATMLKPQVSIPKLHSIDLNYHDSVDLSVDKYTAKFSDYFNSLAVTEKECEEIEKKHEVRLITSYGRKPDREDLQALTLDLYVREKSQAMKAY